MNEFIESPRFPDKIAYGAVGGPTWKTSVATTTGGIETRSVAWEYPRCRYVLSQVPQSKSDFQQLLAFFNNVRGRGVGFRFKDWLDYSVTTTDGWIGRTGYGGGAGKDPDGKYYLYKAYIIGSNTYVRRIRKPVSGTVQTYVNGSPTGMPINYTTGEVTVAPAYDLTTNELRWAGEFDVPVRFDVDELRAEIIAPDLVQWQNIELVELRL